MANAEDDLGSFFAEINEIENIVSTEQEVEPEEVKKEEITVVKGPTLVSQVVTSKPAEIKPHTVYTYDESVYGKYDASAGLESDFQGNNSYYNQPVEASSSSSSNLAAYASNNATQAPTTKLRLNQKFVRKAADEVWVDETLKEWPDNDYRIFVGDLGKDTTTDMLSKAFQPYKSFAKAKVIRTPDNTKSKGYGFVSFLDPMDCAKAIREMDGKYLGARPMKIRKSTWNERDIKEVGKKDKKKRKLYESLGIETS